jgi:hypothetical protein
MGVLRLFVSIANTLHVHSKSAMQMSLDELAVGYNNFAYVGDRKLLGKSIRAWAKELQKRLLNVSDVGIDRLWAQITSWQML